MAYNTVNELFAGIADAIRTKTGKTDKISTQDMPAEIESIEAGGGDDFTITKCNYLFYRNGATNGGCWTDFNNIISKIKQPTSAKYMYYQNGSGTNYWTVSLERMQKITEIDFSKCTSITGLMKDWGIKSEDAGKTLSVNMDLSNCTDVSYAFQDINYKYTPNGILNLEFDFNGTTENVSNFYNCFANLIQGNTTLKISNINMDSVLTVTYMFDGSKGNSLSKLTFKGSFGGKATSSPSNTLDLSKCPLFTVNAFLETMTSISVNESGKTRIFKLSADLYNSLTDEILDLADEKGYTLASA